MAKILIIDDEDLVRFSVAQILAADGYEVDEAADGEGGLEKLAEGRFDLVITDIVMPRKEGVETIIEIKHYHPEMKIIAISGGGRLGSFDYLDLARQFGADSILPKPFGDEELLDAVKAVLAG